jgi:DNA-3-methyladenine glycosylase II
MSLAIRPVQPFDLGRSLDFLGGFSPMHGEQTVTRSEVTKAVSCDGEPVVFRVRATRRGDALDVDLFSSATLRAARWRKVLDRVRAFLSTDEDITPFYARAADDPAMAPLVARLRGLHHVKFPSAFEATCWGAIHQRTRLAVARRMKDALVRRAGRSVVVDGVEHWAFPEPEAVRAIGAGELGELLPGGRRAASVLAIAEAFDGVDEAWLRDAPIAEVRAWLEAIHGVGPFVASLVLYRALGRFDRAAVVSPGLVAAAEAQYGRQLSPRDVQALADGYGSWGGYWMLYIWASTFLS